MKFRLDLKSLTEAIGVTAHATAARGVKAILANLLITINNNKLRFIGTDQEIMMICKAPAEVMSEGHFTIPAKLLQEIVSCIPGDEQPRVTFELASDDSPEVEIFSGRNRFNLAIQGIDDFPPVPVFEDEQMESFSMPSAGFIKALKEAAIAVSTEEGNPVQRSICIDFSNPERPVLVATDSKRLAVTRIENLQVPPSFHRSFIVPSRAIPELQKILDASENVEVSIYNGQLVFSSPNFQLITRLVDGRFPDYNRVLPKESSRALKINRKELAQALKAVGPIARNRNGLVNLDIGTNETKIWSESKEQGKAEIYISSELQGDPINIAFNVKFIQDFINVIADEQVILEMTTPSYPGLLKPGNLEADFKYVLMPMAYSEK